MSKSTKIWLIIAVFLILIGCIIFVGAMTVLNWDFAKLSTGKYETNEYEISEVFGAVSVDTDTADIKLVHSEKSTASVVCCEQEKVKHNVKVEDGTLVIKVNDTRKWYEHIGFNFTSPKVTVYLPQGEYDTLSIKSDTGNVEIPKDFTFKSIDIKESTGSVINRACASEGIKIKTTTGNIYVENISASALELVVSTGMVTALDVKCEGEVTVNVSTGKTYLTNVTCKNLVSKGSTGDISLTSVIAEEKIFVKRSTGKVKLDGTDGADVFIETDTGDVRGSLLSDKVFIAKTDTGKIDVPNTTAGGRCEITTNTGDITVKVQNGI
ncbi:MAG: DUF4097 domain-containing protein [Ruminococcaceae bacterium]|nr:DUF4097 domain-containing protein [Oscillospiraceae bacterium]